MRMTASAVVSFPLFWNGGKLSTRKGSWGRRAGQQARRLEGWMVSGLEVQTVWLNLVSLGRDTKALAPTCFVETSVLAGRLDTMPSDQPIAFLEPELITTQIYDKRRRSNADTDRPGRTLIVPVHSRVEFVPMLGAEEPIGRPG